MAQTFLGQTFVSQYAEKLKEWKTAMDTGSSSAAINYKYYGEGGAGYADEYRDFQLRTAAEIAPSLGITAAQLVTNPGLATDPAALAKYKGISNVSPISAESKTLGTLATPTTYPTTSLQPGATGDAVKQLQDYLVSQGYMTKEQVATGYGTYGPQTTAAVLAMQKALGIDYSSGPGYYGPKTLTALQSGSSATPTANAVKDKDIRTNPTTNQIEQYDATTNEWKPIAGLGQLLGGTSGITSDSGTATQKSAQQIIDEAKAATDAAKKKDEEVINLQKDKTIADLKKELGIEDTTKPATVNFTDTYTALRTSYGLDDMEGQINSISGQMRDIQASLTAGIHAQAGELRPMELIGTRQTELQNQATDKLNALTNAKAVLVDEYNTKLTTVSNIMQFKQLDYNNAKDDYNTKFTQTIQLQQLLTAEEDRATTAEQQQVANAQANLTIMTNLIQDQGKSISEMPEDFQSTFAKEALKAGIPTAAIQAMMDAKPGVSILAQGTGKDADGSQFVYFIDSDKNVSKVYTGGIETKAEAKFSFSSDDRGRLIASGLSNADITNLENDVNTYGKDATLNESGLTDDQKNVVGNILTGVGAGPGGEIKGEEYLNEEWIATNFTNDELKKAAKSAGFTKGGFLGIGVGEEGINEFIASLMNQVKRFRQVEYSDDEILATIMKTYFSGK